MKKIAKIILGLMLLAFSPFIVANIFGLADLRTAEIKNNTQSKEDIILAQNLLNQAIKKQGLDKISQFETYEVICTDDWKGLSGKLGTPWDTNKDEMAMRFSVGDFDGQVEVLAGKKKGFVAGIQSWDYYEKVGTVYEKEVKDDKGKMFILAAFHYFFEFANRLSNAPFIRYAGEGQLKGKTMDKVFVSWGNEATKAYDHYLLWIGKESGLIEATTFTTRDSPAADPPFLYSSLRFDNFKAVNGVLIPFKQTAYVGDPKESITKKYIHQLNVKSFEWDSFAISAIRPFSDLIPIGDDKPVN